MSKLHDLIRYYGPFFPSPFIPKVVVESDGFRVNGKKIYLNEINSVYYRNSYSQTNAIFPIVGASCYEILTDTDTLYFYGKHNNLAEFFDKHLEQETNFTDKFMGLVCRWKKVGSEYRPVSYRDEMSGGINEKLAKITIPIKWPWIVIGGSVAIFILATVGFVIYFKTVTGL